jgi:hypothetical protein
MSWAWLCWVSQIIWARRARVTSAVGLAEVLSVLGEQADKEVDPAKSRSDRLASQDRTSGSISTSYTPVMHLMLYASAAIAKAARYHVPEAL